MVLSGCKFPTERLSVAFQSSFIVYIRIHDTYYSFRCGTFRFLLLRFKISLSCCGRYCHRYATLRQSTRHNEVVQNRRQLVLRRLRKQQRCLAERLQILNGQKLHVDNASPKHQKTKAQKTKQHGKMCTGVSAVRGDQSASLLASGSVYEKHFAMSDGRTVSAANKPRCCKRLTSCEREPIH